MGCTNTFVQAVYNIRSIIKSRDIDIRQTNKRLAYHERSLLDLFADLYYCLRTRVQD